ncbi:hypothetical protein E4U03_01435 [Rothia nasimurium]|uniref:Serine kinase n=1 Tax=Rothia nasimurium TaxID=85336 RepID=A0A4Y9F7Y2_9MICC|nr:hypothetical protein [Rothia nasimurium]MBF0807283.1 hypothetical protein [Rothia nasimurium]TFU24027.1 hypothetical protein E4U03_01435 [Rothia nasimurium]
MRGLLLHPADVPVLVVFEDAADRLWEDSLRAWGSLTPQIIDPLTEAHAEDVRLVVLTRRSAADVVAAYPKGLETTTIDSSDEGLAAERLTVHVTMHLLKAHAGNKHLLHAAVLGDAESGQAVGLVAASGTGKTTAASVLGASFAYLSDETAVINVDDLSIMPYPKPLSVIEEENAPKVQYDPAQRGLQVAAPDSTYALSHLVILDRDKTGQSSVSWERLPLDDALFTIVLQSSGVQQMPQGLGELARLLNRVGGAIKLTYSEITETLPFFRDLLAGQLDIPPLTPDFDYLCAPEPVTGGTNGDKLYQRAAGTEGLAIGDSFLLATSGRLSRISIIGWDIWSFLEVPRYADDIYKAMVELYGDIARLDFDTALRGMVDGQMLKVIRQPDAPEDAPLPDNRT